MCKARLCTARASARSRCTQVCTGLKKDALAKLEKMSSEKAVAEAFLKEVRSSKRKRDWVRACTDTVAYFALSSCVRASSRAHVALTVLRACDRAQVILHNKADTSGVGMRMALLARGRLYWRVGRMLQAIARCCTMAHPRAAPVVRGSARTSGEVQARSYQTSYEVMVGSIVFD